MSLSPAQIATVAHRSGRWDGPDLTTAVAVALAESGGDPNSTNHNTNGTTDYGLFQINSIHTAVLGRGNWADPDANAAMARSIYDDAGGKWTPWSSYNNQRYRLFMGQAAAATGNPAAYAGGADPTAGTTENAAYGIPGLPSVGGITSKLWDLIGGAGFMQRAGMVILGAFLIFLALLKTRAGQSAVSTVRKTATKAVEVAAVAA